MDDAMWKRALLDAKRAEKQFRSHEADATHFVDTESLADWMYDFAASEVERREQERIELVCRACFHGETPQRSDSPPRLPGLAWPWWHDEHRCNAERIYEDQYQRRQREKGEGNGR